MRMDARPKLNSSEIWRIQSDFSHPVHLHLVHFQILNHGGRPSVFDSGWKDTLDLAPGEGASILVRFEGTAAAMFSTVITSSTKTCA